jgi:branched-chain amino acid transport system permease protein
VGGAVGIELPILPSSLIDFQFSSKLPYYYIILVWFVLVYWIVRRIEASRLGYYLRTITASEVAAESVGIDVSGYKIYAFVLTAVLTAACGTFYVQYLLYIDPNVVFPSTISMFVLLTAVLGGSGTAIGPLIGAGILVPLREYTRAFLGGQGRGIDTFIYAVLVVVMAVMKPGGLMQLLPRRATGSKEGRHAKAA